MKILRTTSITGLLCSNSSFCHRIKKGSSHARVSVTCEPNGHVRVAAHPDFFFKILVFFFFFLPFFPLFHTHLAKNLIKTSNKGWISLEDESKERNISSGWMIWIGDKPIWSPHVFISWWIGCVAMDKPNLV